MAEPQQEQKILKFALLAIKEQRAEGDFTQQDKAEMQDLQIELAMLRPEILAKATELLLRA